MSHVPIHCHSTYSALDGLSTPAEIADRCIEIGAEACGLSDHGVVAGHLEFDKEMRSRGLKPIYACELYHGINPQVKGQKRDQAHFLAGALNSRGLRSLWRLVDASASFTHHVPRVTWEMLSEHSEGLFATSACIQGLVSQEAQEGKYDALDRYLEIFGDNFFIELHTYPTKDQKQINMELVQIASERGLPVVYATDAHFSHPDFYDLHDCYVAMQTGESVYTPSEERKMWHPKSLYLQDETEIRENLSYLPPHIVEGALRNTVELAQSIDAELPATRPHLPTFIPSRSPWTESIKSAGELFVDLIQEGLQTRYQNPSQEVVDRALHEANTLIDAGLEDYFLIAWDFCQFCKANGIKKGPGRGSGAGSIVAYLLGLTDIDPIRYGLIFERFYNAGRADSLPDIDIDFPVKERRRVKDYLSQRWGENRVRTIGNVRRLGPKEALNRSYNAFEVAFEEKEEVRKIVESVPDIEALTLDDVGWSERFDPGKTVYVEDAVGDQIEEWITKQMPDRQRVIRKWLEVVSFICTRVSGYGVHASGMVISDVDLHDELPAKWSTDQELFFTSFDMKDVEKRGFAKFDFLGLRNLDTLQEWERLTGEELVWADFADKEFPDKTWEFFERKHTLGIFQLEGPYATNLCKDYKPRSIEDLGVILALNRSGPIRAGVPEAFVARKDGTEPVAYDDPILESILNETYGLWLYQEQVIEFFRALGYSPSEADGVRKILGKKKISEMNQLYAGKGEWKGKGFVEMANKKGIDAEKIWEKIENFSKYSFNKSHSVSYGTISAGTTYAKTRPREFILASIRTDSRRVGEYIGEARRMGIKVHPPDILKSKADIEVIDGDIYFGLAHIKGVKDNAANIIIKLRENNDISTPDLLYESLEKYNKEWSQQDKDKRTKLSPKTMLKSNQIQKLVEAGAFDNYEQRTVALYKKQKFEKELMGVILSDDSEEAFQNNKELIDGCDTYATINYEDVVWLPGVVSRVVPKKVRKNKKDMGIITIEYDGDSVEFAVFPPQWSAYKWLFKERNPGIFNLKRNERGVHFEQGIRLSVDGR